MGRIELETGMGDFRFRVLAHQWDRSAWSRVATTLQGRDSIGFWRHVTSASSVRLWRHWTLQHTRHHPVMPDAMARCPLLRFLGNDDVIESCQFGPRSFRAQNERTNQTRSIDFQFCRLAAGVVSLGMGRHGGCPLPPFISSIKTIQSIK